MNLYAIAYHDYPMDSAQVKRTDRPKELIIVYARAESHQRAVNLLMDEFMEGYDLSDLAHREALMEEVRGIAHLVAHEIARGVPGGAGLIQPGKAEPFLMANLMGDI